MKSRAIDHGRAGWLLTALVLAGLVGGCQRRTQPPPSQIQDESPATVAVGIVRTQLLEKSVSLPATIISDETAMLMARVEAYVDEVLVDIGDEVESGQVLVRLEASEIEHATAQQEAMVKQLQADGLVLQAELAAAHTQLDVIGAELALKNSQRDRLAHLVDTGAIERQRLEEANSSVQASSAMLARYENSVKVAKAKLLKGDSEMALAVAKLHAAEALASYLEIKAPFAGLVINRNVDAGNLVRPISSSDRSKPLLTVAKVDKLRAVVHATDDVGSQLKIGGEVKFVADGMPDQVFAGQLSRTAGSYDKRTRMMRAEVDLDNPRDPTTGRRRLRTGSYGSVTIVLHSATLPVVPESALRRGPTGTAAVVVVRKGVCLITPVKIALEIDGLVGIASGIAAGDQVVVEDPDALEADQTLQESQVKLVTW